MFFLNWELGIPGNWEFEFRHNNVSSPDSTSLEASSISSGPVMDLLDSLFFSPLKRLYAFILKKSIGKFLKSPLLLDQLDVQLNAGVVELRDLELSVEALNELCVDLPVSVVCASVSLIRLRIPWHSLLTESVLVELSGLELVVQPVSDTNLRAFFFLLVSVGLLRDCLTGCGNILFGVSSGMCARSGALELCRVRGRDGGGERASSGLESHVRRSAAERAGSGAGALGATASAARAQPLAAARVARAAVRCHLVSLTVGFCAD